MSNQCAWPTGARRSNRCRLTRCEASGRADLASGDRGRRYRPVGCPPERLGRGSKPHTSAHERRLDQLLRLLGASVPGARVRGGQRGLAAGRRPALRLRADIWRNPQVRQPRVRSRQAHDERHAETPVPHESDRMVGRPALQTGRPAGAGDGSEARDGGRGGSGGRCGRLRRSVPDALHRTSLARGVTGEVDAILVRDGRETPPASGRRSGSQPVAGRASRAFPRARESR